MGAFGTTMKIKKNGDGDIENVEWREGEPDV